MIKEKIIMLLKKILLATDKKHLKALIKEEVTKYGNKSNLDHIDTSLITDMSYLFFRSGFNGDISQWNTSFIEDMSYKTKILIL